MKSVVIVEAKRSPMGAFQGCLSTLKSPEIAAHVIQSLSTKNHPIEEAIIGCVLQAGVGQAPARQAVRLAELDDHVTAVTLNKVCGSGLRSVMMAADQIRLGHQNSILAGGMESMTNAPYFIPKARNGLRMGHGEIMDHMFFDGLEDAYPEKGAARTLMGSFAEATAEKYGFSREAQDQYAKETFEKYMRAKENGYFQQEIAPITLGSDVISEDEPPTKVKVEKFPGLRPAFKKDGTVTAATSSSIADGAAIFHLMEEAHAHKLNLKPLVRIVGYTSHAHEPCWFTTAPVGAMEKLLKQTGWNVNDVDLFEINEAFAVVTMAAIKDLKIDPAKVNVHGGACTLGHPIGASGARILTTLIHALHTHKVNKGIASLCIGGGEGVAMAVERI